MDWDDSRIAEVRDYPNDTYMVLFDKAAGWRWSAGGLTGSAEWDDDPFVGVGFDTLGAAMDHAARQLDLREGAASGWVPDALPTPEVA
ncbi:hypothetical protein Sa4125_29990 [Aureimonas sp. SA4125]|uniref:hypothetical protein n=1 Tax=Aureimonas sp. SA4125 TaxID=2826993 RepID=UPI001CC47CD7|nr:hypothetical protein [Aureimonas sp. SA4125]BDA85457.1 hypothetical protein Sa4125_29990 [Aureimonas sp. SA4125]